jgi:hypothetical protein
LLKIQNIFNISKIIEQLLLSKIKLANSFLSAVLHNNCFSVNNSVIGKQKYNIGCVHTALCFSFIIISVIISYFQNL